MKEVEKENKQINTRSWGLTYQERTHEEEGDFEGETSRLKGTLKGRREEGGGECRGFIALRGLGHVVGCNFDLGEITFKFARFLLKLLGLPEYRM